MPRAARPPRFYFNLRSPYNFFALRALRAHRPDLLDRLEWRPFWEPDETSGKLLAEAGAEFPYTPMSRAKQFYILRDVRRLATARGLELTWPVDAEPWWEPAHLTWFVAERHGLGQAWVERAGRARWLEGRDLCDPATVAELAAELGFEAADTDDPELRAQGAKALLDVVRDGVFGCRTSSTARSPTGAWTGWPTSSPPSTSRARGPTPAPPTCPSSRAAPPT
ncbi:DsbA family protein [Streptomyces diastatochromogenes]|nr:DsbA family protein [Streptomyces diastatochromogenes]